MSQASSKALPSWLPGRRAAVWPAGRLAALAARLVYSAVEGLTFALGRRGAAIVVGAELVVLTARAGVLWAAGTAVAAFSLSAAGRALWALLHAVKAQPDLESVADIWEWEPPGNRYESGAWHILRALARTAETVKKQNPELARLLTQDALQPSELALRLYYLYALHQAAPVWDQFEAGSSPGPGSGQSGTIADAAAGESTEFEAVPDDLARRICAYHGFACFAYDYCDDTDLSAALAEKGFSLVVASYSADITAGSPAFFLCLGEERKEVMLTIRGTYSPEDVFVDLLASGEAFANSEWHCHSGMCKGAMALHARFGTLLAALETQGYQVTLVGHSLGAGVASILTCLLKQDGLKRLQCVAFEPPACMDRGLAESCADVVLSTVIGDDIVPRLSAQIFSQLLKELAAFDWQAVAQEQGLPPALSVVQHLSQLLGAKPEQAAAAEHSAALGRKGGPGRRAAAGGSGEAEAEAAQPLLSDSESVPSSPTGAVLEGAAQEEAERAAVYNPYVPGRVVFIYRRPAEAAPADAGSAGAGSPAGQVIEASTADGEAAGGSQEEGAAGSEEDSPAAEAARTGKVLLPPWHPALRRIRITQYMLSDHFLDSPFALALFAHMAAAAGAAAAQ